MAVAVTAAELAAAIRLGDSTEETAEATRLLAYATAAVVKHVPDAPDAIHNEAVIRLAAYLYDQPNAGRGAAYANALRNSGSAAILLPYRIHRAGVSDAVAEAQAAVGTVGNPVVDVRITGAAIVVTFADGNRESYDLPAVEGDGTDQAARDAAATAAAAAATAGTAAAQAQTTADEAQTTAGAAQTAAVAAQVTADANAVIQTDHDADPNAHHVPTMPGGEAVVNSARLPVGTIPLRLGWAQGRAPSDDIFIRAGNHPIDGAAVGTVAGLSIPVFPPALNSDVTLYLFIWIGTAIDNIADIRLSGGGGTLIGSISNGEAYTLEGVTGTVYVSEQRLSAGTSAFQISAVVGGDLIASQPWVTEQIAALPAGGGGVTYTSLGTGTLSDTRGQFSFADAVERVVIDGWNAGTWTALLFVFQDVAGGSDNRRMARIPVLGGDVGSNNQVVVHFDYGTHSTTTDHDCRLLMLNTTGGLVAVSLPTGVMFALTETLTVYGET